MNKILGLDLSLTSTGVCFLQGESHTTRTITPKSKGPERLHYLRAELEAILASHNPDVIIMEDYAFGANGKITAIAEWGGVARLTCYDYLRLVSNVIVLTMSPTALKKFTCGSGGAKKEQMLLEAYKKWGVSFKTNDECDAFALAKAGQAWLLQHQGADPEITAKQREAIEKIVIIAEKNEKE